MTERDPENHGVLEELSLDELFEKGGDLYRKGNWDESLECYSKALAIAEEKGRSEKQADAHVQLGRILRRRDDWEGALSAYRKSLAIFKTCEMAEKEASVYNCIGVVLFENGKWEQAEEYYSKGLEIAEELGDVQLVGEINNNLGALASARGDLDNAIAHYQQSLPRFERQGNPRGLAEAYHNLGMAFAEKGDLALAREYYEKSLEIAREIGELVLTSITYLNRAQLHLDLRDLAEAKNFVDRAAEIATAVGDNLGLAEAYKVYGLIDRESGALRSAEKFLNDCLKLNEEYRSPLGAAEAYRELGLTYKRQGDSKKTLQMLSRSLRIFQDLKARRDVRNLSGEIEELERLYISIIKQIAADVELKDPYTLGHSRRVAMYSIALANKMGLNQDEKKAIVTAAYLHDVGKIKISKEILSKPGKLSRYEYQLIKRHPVLGLTIMETVDFPWDVKPLVKHHHERFDGKGYPDGLCGTSIPLGARIIAVADVFDALTSCRSYRPARTEDEALGMVLADSGTAFDPDVVDEFAELVRRIYEFVREKADGGDKSADISEIWDMSSNAE